MSESTPPSSPPPQPPQQPQTQQPYQHQSPPPGPRRVRGGVRLRPRDGVVVHSPLTARWVERLAGRISGAMVEAGIDYARMGQVASFEIRVGCLAARVQGTAPRPYGVQCTFRPLPDATWDAIVEKCAEEAIHLVRLMSGEIPDAMLEVLAAEGRELLPAHAEELTLECTCETFLAEQTCRHLGAVGYVLADRLATDPLHALTLRGLPPGVLIERVRQTRAIRSRGRATAHAEPHLPEADLDPRPLEECFADFWRPGAEFAAVESRVAAQQVRCALLRRLGPSPLGGRFPLVGLLQSIYESVAADVRGERLRADAAFNASRPEAAADDDDSDDAPLA